MHRYAYRRRPAVSQPDTTYAAAVTSDALHRHLLIGAYGRRQLIGAIFIVGACRKQANRVEKYLWPLTQTT
jgi:hypothetical protein